MFFLRIGKREREGGWAVSSKNWIPNVPMSIKIVIFTIFIKKSLCFIEEV